MTVQITPKCSGILEFLGAKFGVSNSEMAEKAILQYLYDLQEDIEAYIDAEKIDREIAQGREVLHSEKDMDDIEDIYRCDKIEAGLRSGKIKTVPAEKVYEELGI